MGKNKKKRTKKRQSARAKAPKQSPAPNIPKAEPSEISQLFESGQYEAGINLLKANPQPGQRPLLDQWGRRLMKERDFKNAASLFEIVCQLYPQDDKAFNALAVSNSMAGNQEQALEAMKRCTELAPGSWRHHFNLGKLYILREEWEEAKAELNASLDGATGPQLSQIQEYLSICQQKIDFPVVDLDGTDKFSVPPAAPSESPADPAPPVQAESKVKEFGLTSSKNSNILEPLPAPPIARTDHPLNILFVQEAPCIRNYKMAVALRSIGHSVSLAYTKALLSQMYPGLPDDTYNECIRVRNNQHLWEISGDYDLVHCHNEPDIPTVIAMAGDAPVIHDTHDLISLRENGDANLAFFEGLANRGAQGRVYSTKYQRDEAKNLYGVKGPSLVFSNYISLNDAPSTSLPKRSEQDGCTHIVYEGGIGGNAHRNFLELFSNLSQAGIHIHIYPTRYDEQLAALFGQNGRIHYYQPLSPKKIMEEMTQYDIGIIPFNLATGNRRFLDSTIANKLYEYLAAGLPVVASDLVSYREYFSENPVGFTFNEASDIIAGLDNLRHISSSTDLRQYCKTYEGEIHEMESFYLEVLGDKPNQTVEEAPAVAPWQQVETEVGGSKLTFSM